MTDTVIPNDTEQLGTHLFERRKTPVVLQSEAMECGLACLSMAMATFGRNLDLPVLREKHPVSLRGMSVGRMIDVADAEGFLLTAYESGPLDLAPLKLPGILHWKGQHFVVLTSYQAGKSVTIHDPAVGIRHLTWSQFVESFSGVACELEPLASMKPEVKKSRLSILSFVKQTYGYGGMLAKMLLLALLAEGLALVSPLLLQTVVDEVIPVRDDRLLWALAAGFAGLAIIKAGLGLVRSWLSMALTGMLALTMKQMTFRHMLRLPLNWFEKRGIGTVTARFNSLDNIRNVLTENVLMTLVDTLIAVVMIVVLLVYEWRLALLTIGFAAVSFGVTIFMYKRYAVAASEGVVADAEENRALVEAVTSMPAVKMFGQETRQLQGFRRTVMASTNRMLDMMRVRAWHGSILGVIGALSDVAVVATSAYLVLSGSISLGLMFGFYAYRQILSDKLNGLSSSYFQFRVLSVYTNNVADVLLSAPEPDNHRALAVSARPALEFRNVSFTYDEADAPTVSHFSLRVAPGEIVGITGRSGGGKSTLIKLLTGSLEPQEGQVCLDEASIAGVPPKVIREHMAVVLQSDHLFTGTLLDNVTMFDPHPDMPRVHQAIEDAALSTEVGSMPAGLSTYILGHAPTLSGGQRQRLMLARAFYKNAAVLVLDEATSALDVASEVHICEAIRKKGLTTLLVAHRQETLARCDRIVRLGAAAEPA